MKLQVILKVALFYVASLAHYSNAQDFEFSENELITIGSTLTLQSNILGEGRELLISLPESYSTSDKLYPVVYILDPTDFYQFQYATSVIKALSDINKIPEIIVVGVQSTDRSKDMTPSIDSTEHTGANNFRRFFKEELQIFISQQYRTQSYKIIVGHSFGGLFAIDTLIQQPDTFDAYIAISPSIWWDNGKLVEQTKSLFEEGNDLNKTLFTTLANEDSDSRIFYDNFLDVVSKNSPDGLSVDNMYFENETHTSTPMMGIYYGILSVYKSWEAPESLDSLNSLITHYESLSEHYGYTIEVPMETTADVAWRLLYVEEYPEALRVFEFNIANYGGVAITYSDLAWGLRRNGRLQESLPYFEKAVEIGRSTNSKFLPEFLIFRDEVVQLLSDSEN